MFARVCTGALLLVASLVGAAPALASASVSLNT
jgi:hypothetical protein